MATSTLSKQLDSDLLDAICQLSLDMSARLLSVIPLQYVSLARVQCVHPNWCPSFLVPTPEGLH